MRHLATLGVPPPEDLALSAGLSTPVLILGGATVAVLAADVPWLNYRVRQDERRAAGE